MVALYAIIIVSGLAGQFQPRARAGQAPSSLCYAILAEVGIVKPLRRVACLRNVGPKRRRRKRGIYLFLGQSHAIHRRYTEHLLLCVPYGSLQGVTVRPVPCNYYVIQQDIALSRR